MKKIGSLKKLRNAKNLLLLTFISLLLLSCAPDIYVDPPNSLRGYYIGEYIIRINVDTDHPTSKRSQIELTFTDVQIFGDFIYPTEEDRIFCDFRGSYTLEGNLDMNSFEISSQKCGEDEIPFGVFSVKWSLHEDNGDSLDILTLTQSIPPNEIRELILEKQPDIEEE